MVGAQLSTGIVLNAMNCGMDMAGLWPKYINIRRGAYIMVVLGNSIQPWQLSYTAPKFLAVMSGFGVFLAPATGFLLVDYHVIRKRKLRLEDLYAGNPSSIYWFNGGFNWRAFVAFLAGMWPLIPGLYAKVNEATDGPFSDWLLLYNLTFIVGLLISFVVFWLLCWLFPVPGLGKDTPFSVNDTPSEKSANQKPDTDAHQPTGSFEPANIRF